MACVWGKIYENHCLKHVLINDESSTSKVFMLHELQPSGVAVASESISTEYLNPDLATSIFFGTLQKLKLHSKINSGLDVYDAFHNEHILVIAPILFVTIPWHPSCSTT